MNILLVSQCDKRALTETRRLLDQFAERRGDRTWQTPITHDGLETLHKLLRKSARKNTAVACHWIRGADHSELLWVVGDRRRFNAQGAVPTNTTTRNILRQADENNWHTAEQIRTLVDLAGLMHDLGKACDAFQSRLVGTRGGERTRNVVRHEWISLRLLQAFVGADADAQWLARLAAPTVSDDQLWLARLQRDCPGSNFGSPFKAMQAAPLAQALGWLVVTHHRLPELPEKQAFQTSMLSGLLERLAPSWNEPQILRADPAEAEPYWRFAHGLPISHPEWRARAARMAQRLLQMLQRAPHDSAVVDPLANPFLMHLSRMALMLADHHYSSLAHTSSERLRTANCSALLANTQRSGAANQPLDEHLLGVAQHGAEVSRFLPRFTESLPGLGAHKRLKQRATQERYRWQDKAAELLAGWRVQSAEHGAFIVNMASTGCGKTLANARMMYALADAKQGLRCAFAMGLRTLTLQTGRAFRDMLQLGDDQIAIRVGGTASRALFEYHEQRHEDEGSASTQALIDEDMEHGVGSISFDGDIQQNPLLRRAVANDQVRKLLVAPLLVCTIDHLTPSTESQRGGRQIAPMLRLLSGDLVLDEPDDFGLGDLPALTRLVHWAGLLGARLALSSATLPPSMVQGLFEAYRDGREHHQRNCGARPGGVAAPPAIVCAWVDEFDQQAQTCSNADAFVAAHSRFALARHTRLAQLAAEPRRLADLLTLDLLAAETTTQKRRREWPELAARFAPVVLQAALRLHAVHHSTDQSSGKRVSFGLIRMANIEPLVCTALELFKQNTPEGTQIHLCVYHSQYPLLLRSAIESQLDRALARHDPEAVFQLPDVRNRVDAHSAMDQLFVVLGSPVTEVGRDHDYDWAVVEPSSMRSLIQLAGRVRRHRVGQVKEANVLVFDHNLRHFRDPGRAAFKRPGFEEDEGEWRLWSHDLRHLLPGLLRQGQPVAIDARSRIVCAAPDKLAPQRNLIDLEHRRMQREMLAPESNTQARAPAPVLSRRAQALMAGAPQVPQINASTWWRVSPRDACLSAVLQQQQRFRESSGLDEVDVSLLPDEEAEAALLHIVMDGKQRGQQLFVLNDQLCDHLPDAAVTAPQVCAWSPGSYMVLLAELAEDQGIPLRVAAQRYGIASVRNQLGGWRFHDVLGFTRKDAPS